MSSPSVVCRPWIRVIAVPFITLAMLLARDPGAPEVRHQRIADYLIACLTAASAR